MNTFQDLLNTVRGVGLAVEFPGDDVLEQFSAGDSVSVLRFNSISREHVAGSREGWRRVLARVGEEYRAEERRRIFNPENKSSVSSSVNARSAIWFIFRLYAHKDVQLPLGLGARYNGSALDDERQS